MQTLQIRNVPVEVADILKGRAARKGMSLSEYLRAEVEVLAANPTLEDVLNELAAKPRRRLDVNITEIIDEGRAELGFIEHLDSPNKTSPNA